MEDAADPSVSGPLEIGAWGAVIELGARGRESSRGARGAGRPAGQHESAAAGEEVAQSPPGPRGGDGSPSVPRPHQRGGTAGKLRDRTGGGRAGVSQSWPPPPRAAANPAGRRLGRLLPLGQALPITCCELRSPAFCFQHLLTDVVSVFWAFTSELQGTVGENCSTLHWKGHVFLLQWTLAVSLQPIICSSTFSLFCCTAAV